MELGYDYERDEGMSLTVAESRMMQARAREVDAMVAQFAPPTIIGFDARRVNVVDTRYVNNSRRIEEALIPRSSIVALQPVEIPPSYVAPPFNLIPETIIPLEVRAPTARLVSDHGQTGSGMPWTASPASLAIAGVPIGALIIQVGRAVIAQIAIAGLEELLGQAKKKYNQPNVQFRYRTGHPGALGKGNVVKPRGPDGSTPEGTDPYENPDDFSLWRPWTWF